MGLEATWALDSPEPGQVCSLVEPEKNFTGDFRKHIYSGICMPIFLTTYNKFEIAPFRRSIVAISTFIRNLQYNFKMCH